MTDAERQHLHEILVRVTRMRDIIQKSQKHSRIALFAMEHGKFSQLRLIVASMQRHADVLYALYNELYLNMIAIKEDYNYNRPLRDIAGSIIYDMKNYMNGQHGAVLLVSHMVFCDDDAEKDEATQKEILDIYRTHYAKYIQSMLNNIEAEAAALLSDTTGD